MKMLCQINKGQGLQQYLPFILKVIFDSVLLLYELLHL